MSLDTTFIKREHIVKYTTYLYPSHIKFLSIVSTDEQMPEAAIFRDIIDKFQKLYLHRKGTFVCQCCGNERKNKERHDITVESETFAIGDCCFFNDAYKAMIRRFYANNDDGHVFA